MNPQDLPASRDQLNLFGLDLGRVADYLRQGWAEALRAPALAWLTPVEPVRLLRPDGGEATILAGVPTDKAFRRVQSLAVELPEELVLRRSLVLPHMADAELRAAVALEARSASPFPAEDLAWGYRAGSEGNRGLAVELVLSSRRRIDAYLGTLRERLGALRPEVWTAGPVMIPGFGEAARHGRMRRARLRVLGLLALALLLLGALALTPTLHLRERAVEAQLAYTRLARETAPQAELRARIVAANDRLAAARALGGAQVTPLALIDALTRNLPDDTTLNLLEIRGDKVRFAGQAANAAGIMQKLGAHPAFRDVRAPSPSARAGAGKESFTVEYTAVPEALRP